MFADPGRESSGEHQTVVVALSLARAGPAAKSAVPTLLERLKDPQGLPERDRVHTRKTLVFALGRIGPDAKEAVPVLLAILREPDVEDDLRLAVVDALRRIGPAAREAIPALKALSRDPSSQMRRAASEALEKLEGH
jgi:HEAT repeat protein